jgi:hypothetical protein
MNHADEGFGWKSWAIHGHREFASIQPNTGLGGDKRSSEGPGKGANLCSGASARTLASTFFINGPTAHIIASIFVFHIFRN